MIRPKGMTPAMFESWIRACFYAEVSPDRVTQTIGNAKASAGYHAKDGQITINGAVKINYCAAVDFSVRGLTRSQIKKLLENLAKQGWVAWFRDWEGNEHIHAVYVGIYMKPQLAAQVIDFLNDRTGLAGHAKEKFYTAPTSLDKPLAQAFVRANPAYKKKVPAYLLEV